MAKLMRVFVGMGLMLCSVISSGQKLGRSKDYPIDPETGLVSIMDSVKVGPDYPTTKLNGLVIAWGDWRAFPKNLVMLYGGPDKRREVGVGFIGLEAVAGAGPRFMRRCQLDYRAIKPNGDTDSSDRTDGDLFCHLVFWHRGDYIIVEFTNLEFSTIENELAKFEDAALLSNDGVHRLMGERDRWGKIRGEYFDRLRILSRDLKKYLDGHH